MSLSNGAFSERLQSGDPALLNRMAWSARWSDRAKSCQYASRALEVAEGCQNKRSRIARGLAFRTLSWQAKWRGNFDEALRLADTVIVLAGRPGRITERDPHVIVEDPDVDHPKPL